MATSIRKVGARLLSRRFSLNSQVPRFSSSTSLADPNNPSTEISEEVEYPPIKPKYPPGKWGKLTPKHAWEIHEESKRFLQEKTAKFRLERLAGDYKDEKPVMHKMKFIDIAPGTLPFKQYITKTHTINTLPEMYNEVDPTAPLQRLRTSFVDIIEHEADQFIFFLEEEYKKADLRYKFGHRLLGRILKVVMAGLSSSHPHLLRAQVDESVRVAAFWKRCGFESENAAEAVKGAKYGDIANFQWLNSVNYQVRTELPLPEVLPVDDPLCLLGEVPDFKYSPTVANMTHEKERPFSVSGHWIGDPCEFGHVTGVVAKNTHEKILDWRGDTHLDQDSLGWGLGVGFGSTVAQAHNQGFFYGADITYPFVNQVILTDGQWFRFFVYQLNTLQMWKDDEGCPTRNLLWASPRMSLYEVIENGRVKGLNEDVLKQIIQFMCVQPEDRGIDMRPYLPEEPAPVQKKKYINDIGEEPLPFHKPGRYEYPRNAVYF